ncbi:MAG TPA: hypothetical protein VFN52_00395 [Acidiferrobacteraceae bacterium]|nr:hypothetical protein [Acidiferrobacteraceae bacterium]
MEPVIQQEPTGCGIASVAALAGRSYYEVQFIAQTLGISARDPRLWSDPQPVRRLLEYFGMRADLPEIPFRSWASLPDRALLAIKWHLENGTPCWHWAVFVREDGRSAVLDSNSRLRSHRRTDFGRMKPRWYIPITDRP